MMTTDEDQILKRIIKSYLHFKGKATAKEIIQDKSELVRQQVNVSENLQARINILERALEEEE